MIPRKYLTIYDPICNNFTHCALVKIICNFVSVLIHLWKWQLNHDVTAFDKVDSRGQGGGLHWGYAMGRANPPSPNLSFSCYKFLELLLQIFEKVVATVPYNSKPWSPPLKVVHKSESVQKKVHTLSNFGKWLFGLWKDTKRTNQINWLPLAKTTFYTIETWLSSVTIGWDLFQSLLQFWGV